MKSSKPNSSVGMESKAIDPATLAASKMVKWCGQLPALCTNEQCRKLCYPIRCEPKKGCILTLEAKDVQHIADADIHDAMSGASKSLNGHVMIARRMIV
jgi:hypothetical protein